MIRAYHQDNMKSDKGLGGDNVAQQQTEQQTGVRPRRKTRTAPANISDNLENYVLDADMEQDQASVAAARVESAVAAKERGTAAAAKKGTAAAAKRVAAAAAEGGSAAAAKRGAAPARRGAAGKKNKAVCIG
jgi:hypothetical protein